MTIRLLATGLLLTGFLATQTLDAADARERSRQTSIQGSNGHGVTRNLNVRNDAASGTHSRSGSITANNGKALTREASASRTANGGQSAASMTGPNGGSASRSAATSCTDGAGCTRQAQRTVTSAAGEQWTRERSSSATPNN